MKATVFEAVLDCADPARIAKFWAALLETSWGVPFDGWAVVDADPMPLCFQRVPEPKVSKNRLHMDFLVLDLETAIEHAKGLGAQMIRPVQMEGDSGFAVLADPDGNEFCFVTDPTQSFAKMLRSSLR